MKMKLIHALFLIAFIFAFTIAYIFLLVYSENIEGEFLKDVTSEIQEIFKTLDINSDGYLDSAEFLAFRDNYRILRSTKQHEEDSSNTVFQQFPHLESNIGDQIIYLETRFKPLDLNSLKKNVSFSSEDAGETLSGLLSWTTAHKEGQPFSSKAFSLFLPEDNSVKVGSPFWIIKPQLNKYSQPLSSNRYYPPAVEKKLHPLFAMFSCFHPRPFLFSRFMPQGTAAVLRAISDNFYDIIFRAHVEFQLNEPPLYPFWFTPSQFSGQLIINKDASVVKYFQLHVPYRKLNVDMEWFNGPSEENMEVDIGCVPHMALVPKSISAAHSSLPGASENVASIEWKEEIEMEDAIDSLEKHFFPFKEDYQKRPTEKISKLATICLQSYNFPVESIIFFPNGSVVHQINANSLLSFSDSIFPSFQDPIEKHYLEFLEIGLQKSQEKSHYSEEL